MNLKLAALLSPFVQLSYRSERELVELGTNATAAFRALWERQVAKHKVCWGQEDVVSMSRTLTVEVVKQVIEQARSAGADPPAVAIGLFEGLGDHASVTGEVLAQGLRESGIPLPAEAKEVLDGIATIEKNAEQVQLVMNSQLQLTVRGTQFRLGPTMTAAIQRFPDGIALADIKGVAVNKFVWIDIQRLQYHDNGGKRSVRVDTSFGGKEFQLR